MSEIFELARSFRFEAAHRLPAAPTGHPCRELHGHSYEIEIHIEGRLDTEHDWVLDYFAIDAAFEPLRQRLDHSLLNDFSGLENPTSEVLAAWMWDELIERLPCLSAIVVRETPRSACAYRRSRHGE
jgi:6-pyruvoyltetrahydropterin/6-carboxytetrahydropterin synthase